MRRGFLVFAGAWLLLCTGGYAWTPGRRPFRPTRPQPSFRRDSHPDAGEGQKERDRKLMSANLLRAPPGEGKPKLLRTPDLQSMEIAKRQQLSQQPSPEGRPPPTTDAESKVSAWKARYFQSWEDFQRTSSEQQSIFAVVLCGTQLGNLGSILRTCCVLGVGVVIVMGLGLLDREGVKIVVSRAQLDRKTHWDIKVVQAPSEQSARDTFRQLRSMGIQLVGLTAETSYSKPVWDVNLTLPRTALVFGSDSNDGADFPDASVTELDIPATIPMQTGPDDMLNLSQAVSAVLYERRRQLYLQIPRER